MALINSDNIKWIVGTLAIPLTVGILSHYYEEGQTRRQINDARLRLYTELLSKREEADTTLRQAIFDKVLAKYLAPSGKRLVSKMVALELLAANFHDSLDLSPLFWQIDREIQQEPGAIRGKQRANLVQVANLVKDRQIAALEFGGGTKGGKDETSRRDKTSVEIHVPLGTLEQESSNPLFKEAFAVPDPNPFADTGSMLRRTLKLWVVKHEKERRRVYVTVQAEPRDGERPQEWRFWLDVFDFPMATFTRISQSERFAVVLTHYAPPDSIGVKLLYFPSTRIGARDKPFVDEVLADLVRQGR